MEYYSNAEGFKTVMGLDDAQPVETNAAGNCLNSD